MAIFFLGSRIHEVIHPVVLELILVWIKSIGLSDHFDLLVVVRCPAIRSNDCSLKVSVHEVCTTVFLDGLSLFFVGALLAL